MGQVYLAEHVKMGRKSAIKVLNPTMVYDPDAVARFNREAANASRISHPSVCAIYDFGETPEGLIYLAMEFVEGQPLKHVLEREGALPVARAVTIFAQVADALQAAHDLGIVHRDLKPDNVMIARARDGTDVVKVVDFGIAKLVGSDASQEVTKTGLVIGTPEFMSPEQLSGDKLDGRSDIYSLGLVFFKMLTGRLPFAALSIPRRTPVPPVRRRSLIPVIVGAALVLGAGGAALLSLGTGRRANGAARLDTMRGVPPPGAADSTSRAVPPPPPAPQRAADSRTPRRQSGRDAGATHPAPP